MNNDFEREYGWDDTIENDGPDFILLPPGDYDFEVTDFERARHGGSDKLPACNKAVVHIKIAGTAGTSTVRHQLFLHSKTEGLLCNFFTAIGQRRKGEKFTMNWNAVVGSRGRCKLGIRTYDGKEYNEIKRFYEPSDTGTAAPAAPSAAQPPKGFEPGRF